MPFQGTPLPAPRWLKGPIGRAWDAGTAAMDRTLKRTRTARRLDPGRRLGMPFEELTLTTGDGVRLAAWYVPGAELPASAPSPPPGLAAVLHHHYGGQKATVLPWIHLFWSLGVPSLAFDGRGHAASDPSPPGRGSFQRRSADVRAACDELRRRGARRVLAFGQSQGAAALVIGLAGRRDVAGVILESGPAPDMATAAWGLAGNMLGSRGRREPWTRALLAARILPGTQPARYLATLWTSLALLRRTPLLWLHGDRDDVIDRRWSAAWFAALAPSDGRWRARRVPDADHVRCLAVAGDAVRAEVGDFVAGLGGRTGECGAARDRDLQ